MSLRRGAVIEAQMACSILGSAASYSNVAAGVKHFVIYMMQWKSPSFEGKCG
jgi:hypothetical protein